jgi:cephalosporin-C deacetylase-like acetyl esterase
MLRLTGASAAAPLFAVAQDITRYRTYSRCLPDFLRDLATASCARRDAALAKLTTPQAVRDRQQWVTKTFWDLVGGMPERTPLHPRVTGSFSREGYRVEKVVYESQPEFHISGNLYIPTTGSPPYPGVLFQMGHSTNGKAYAGYQKCCQGLARLGFVVLGFDPMGQGERTYYPGPVPSRTRLRGGADDEHTVPGKQMLLVGDSSVRLQTWDAVRSLDYLASLPIVDTGRLASAGQSGGGTNTMLLAAVDDRLAAAAVACGNTENVAVANFNPPGATDDAEQNFPGAGPLGFDRWDLLYPLAPKPLLVLPSARDFFGTYSPNYISSGAEEFAKLRKVYEVMGHADRLAWADSPLPHGLAYNVRVPIYNWFNRWLKNGPPVHEEPPVAPEPDELLFATEGGSTVRAFHGQTPHSMVRRKTLERRPGSLETLLGVDRPNAPIVSVRKTEFRRTAIEAVEVQSAPKVWIPGYLFQPRADVRRRPLILLLDPAGRGQWQEDSLYDNLASSGFAVCALDLRGIGDLTPEYGRGSARYNGTHNTEQHYAWSSLILGKPLLGQRVTDIIAAVKGLRARPDMAGRKIVLAARGILTVPALFAASFEKTIDALYLSGGLVSYRNVLDMEEYLGGNYARSETDLFGSFVPRLLLHTDLPEVTASIAPRRVILAGAIDAAGKPVDAAEVKSIYTAAPDLQVMPRAGWDAAVLQSVAETV